MYITLAILHIGCCVAQKQPGILKDKRNLKKCKKLLVALIKNINYTILRREFLRWDEWRFWLVGKIKIDRVRIHDCLLLQAHYDYFICIPYRSHISHPYAYHFRESARSRKSHSGLDYSKTVIIQNPEYITSENAIIDHDE